MTDEYGYVANQKEELQLTYKQTVNLQTKPIMYSYWPGAVADMIILACFDKKDSHIHIPSLSDHNDYSHTMKALYPSD